MEKELIKFKLYLIQGKGSFDGKIVKRSPRTVELHIRNLRHLLQSVPKLSVDEIEQHLLTKKEQGNKGIYLNKFIDVLRLYGRFKGTKKYEKLTMFVEEGFIAAPMSDEEIEAFLNLPPPTYSRYLPKPKKTITYQFTAGWEAKTMFWKLFAYHPVRPGGIAQLTVDDIDWGLDALHFSDKTRDDDIIPIRAAVKEDLKKYLETITTHHLFPSARGGTNRQGGVFDDVDWGSDFHKRIKRLGIKRKNLRPYSLRHSSLTRLLKAGNNIFMVMNLAGQKNPDTLMKYWHNDLESKREAMEKDSLGKHTLPLYERQKMFHEQVFKLLRGFAKSAEEERLMLNALLNLP